MAFYDNVDTTKKFRLGARKTSVDNREFIYLTGVASTTANSWVSYDEAGVTAGLDTDVQTSGPVAIAMAAVDSTSKYGWYGIWGSFTGRAIDPVADNKTVYATSTVFVCDDAATSVGRVNGATWRSINDSVAGTATVQIQYPYLGEDLSA